MRAMKVFLVMCSLSLETLAFRTSFLPAQKFMSNVQSAQLFRSKGVRMISLPGRKKKNNNNNSGADVDRDQINSYYRTLGISQGSSFAKVIQAHRELTHEHKDDPLMRMRLDDAKDGIMTSSLSSNIEKKMAKMEKAKEIEKLKNKKERKKMKVAPFFHLILTRPAEGTFLTSSIIYVLLAMAGLIQTNVTDYLGVGFMIAMCVLYNKYMHFENRRIQEMQAGGMMGRGRGNGFADFNGGEAMLAFILTLTNVLIGTMIAYGFNAVFPALTWISERGVIHFFHMLGCWIACNFYRVRYPPKLNSSSTF